MSTQQVIVLLLAIIYAANTNSANILCLMGVASHSHQLWSNVLFQALAAKGHQLTIVTLHPSDQPMENITFIHLESAYEAIYKHYAAKYAAAQSFEPQSALMNTIMWYEYQMPTCQGTLASEGFKTAIELATLHEEKIDLIIADTTNGATCLLSLAHLFADAPIVGLSAFKVFPDLFEVVRNGAANAAKVPHFTTAFSEEMQLWQRWYNTVLYAVGHFYRHYITYPVVQSLLTHNEHVQNARIPTTQEAAEALKQRVKVVLVNTHSSLDYAQPLPPNVIEVAGMQIKEAKPLPQDIVQFIQQSKLGAVFMSFGSNLRLEMLGLERINAILTVIRRFPEYVFLWKVEDKKLVQNPPKNLFMSDWYPQKDILAHPKIKAFFTHGGSMSIQEAAYHGVPVIALPFFLDQTNNAHRACERGLGTCLDFTTFSEANFYNALSSILTNPEYAQSAARLQFAFRNRAQKPLDTAVWWVEQLLAHPQGFDYLVSKSAGKLSYFTEHSWDVLLIMLILFVMLFVNSYIVIKQCLSGFRKTKTSKTDKHVSKIKKLKPRKDKEN